MPGDITNKENEEIRGCIFKNYFYISIKYSSSILSGGKLSTHKAPPRSLALLQQQQQAFAALVCGRWAFIALGCWELLQPSQLVLLGWSTGFMLCVQPGKEPAAASPCFHKEAQTRRGFLGGGGQLSQGGGNAKGKKAISTR